MSKDKAVTSVSSNKYLIIHGHFYQPPRENPWIEEIEIQQSAHPFHDWNQRIKFECYQPNSMARIYDSSGKIIDLVNNFEQISFNFGPTLLSWLQKHDIYTYKKIINADKRSRKLYSGHGNAVAQAYNHMIMPLANERDRLTQIRWGAYDFKHRFGRMPEAMWLPETAVNEAVLVDLISEGIKFIILSPYQAKALRHFKEKKFHDVSGGQINTCRAYRCYISENKNKYIDVFFYNNEIARNISFGEALKSADSLIGQLKNSCPKESNRARLVQVATD